jgi:hypothetical protein
VVNVVWCSLGGLAGQFVALFSGMWSLLRDRGGEMG